MALKAPTDRYETLSVYDRTFIETFQSLVNSGNYAPGPLVMELTRDATQALMAELGFAISPPVVGALPVVWHVWKDPTNPHNQ